MSMLPLRGKNLVTEEDIEQVVTTILSLPLPFNYKDVDRDELRIALRTRFTINTKIEDPIEVGYPNNEESVREASEFIREQKEKQ